MHIPIRTEKLELDLNITREICCMEVQAESLNRDTQQVKINVSEIKYTLLVPTTDTDTLYTIRTRS